MKIRNPFRIGLLIVVSGCIGWTAGCRPADEPVEPVMVTPTEEAVEVVDIEVDIPDEPVTAEPLVNDGTWVAAASSVEGDEYGPERAIDGDSSTRWSSVFENNEWWQVDFGQEHVLQNVEIHWEDAHAATYRVKLSSDGETWEVVHDERSGKPGVATILFEARPARFVRIECGRRATEWGFSFYEVKFNVAEPPRMTATASSGAGDFAPRFAIDGDLTTRWSSEFRDDEWLQVEFERPTTLTGMRILWETAFAEQYDIAVSDDGREWRTIYSVTDGDGQTDILLFEPVETKFIRVVCRQRGTGWGNSIWNIEFMDDTQQVHARASSSIEDHGPERVIDGRTETFWKSAEGGEQWVELQFPGVMGLGGLVLQWGDDHAVTYAIKWSEDGKEWNTAHREMHSSGGTDHLFFSAMDARYLRIVCETGVTDDGYALAHIELKDRDAQATPLREYQARARNAERGRYPMWLTREQEFWTVVGLPEDDQESLLGETGVFEPFKGGFSVLPFVRVDGDLYSWADVELTQDLEDQYLPLPWAEWITPGWNLNVAAQTFGGRGAAFTAVRYRLINSGVDALSGDLVLAVRPVQVNPTWQHGGMSPIRTAECVTHDDSATIRLNDRPLLILPEPPSRMGTSALSDGDVNDYLVQGLFPDKVRASDDQGRVGVGLEYTLEVPAGEYRDVIVVYPLHEAFQLHPIWQTDPSGAFESQWAQNRAAWRELLGRVVIDIPEQRLIDTMRSNLAYVFINYDPPFFKPGTRNYNHSWIRDGALTGAATLRMGHVDPVRVFIERYSQLINEDGWVPYIITEDGQPIGYNPDMDGGEGHEFDSQGQFVYIVRQYYDFTEDDALLALLYPKVVHAMEYGREIRKRRLTDQYRDTVYWGILPHSNSHEGYFPAQHSYWDNFFQLRGLKDAAYLADRMNDPETAAWMREEEEHLRECLIASIRAVIERDNIPYIPGAADLGDEDPTSTSVAVITCEEAEHLPQRQLRQTFERYWERVSRRHAGTPDTFTPYEVRNAEVFIHFNQRDRALAMFRHFMEDSMRPRNWNHMAEVVHERPRAPSYIGDMPHTWVGSDYINAVLSMFSYVRHDGLVLAAGVDPAWMEEGVRVDHLPTPYGTVAFTMREDGDAVVFASDARVQPPNGIALPLPEAWRAADITVNDEPANIVDNEVRFDRLPVRIRIR